jgi:Sec-independent protein translocase protein TatA
LKGDNAYLPEPAIKACNEVNLSQFSVKMYCDEDKGSIKLVHQVFLKSCKNLTPEAIKAVLKEMKEANEMFNNVYTAFEKKSSELKAKKQEEARKQAEEEQKRQEEETKEYIIDTPLAKLALTDMKVYSVDAKDKELSKVDTSVRLEDAKYICPLITVVAEKVGTYNILVKIYNEKGKILLYPGNDYSIETPIEVKKAGKDFEYSLDKFGTANGNMWAKGTYTVELFFEEEGELKDLGTKTFEIK